MQTSVSKFNISSPTVANGLKNSRDIKAEEYYYSSSEQQQYHIQTVFQVLYPQHQQSNDVEDWPESIDFISVLLRANPSTPVEILSLNLQTNQVNRQPIVLTGLNQSDLDGHFFLPKFIVRDFLSRERLDGEAARWPRHSLLITVIKKFTPLLGVNLIFPAKGTRLLSSVMGTLSIRPPSPPSTGKTLRLNLLMGQRFDTQLYGSHAHSCVVGEQIYFIAHTQNKLYVWRYDVNAANGTNLPYLYNNGMKCITLNHSIQNITPIGNAKFLISCCDPGPHDSVKLFSVTDEQIREVWTQPSYRGYLNHRMNVVNYASAHYIGLLNRFPMNPAEYFLFDETTLTLNIFQIPPQIVTNHEPYVLLSNGDLLVMKPNNQAVCYPFNMATSDFGNARNLNYMLLPPQPNIAVKEVFPLFDQFYDFAFLLSINGNTLYYLSYNDSIYTCRRPVLSSDRRYVVCLSGNLCEEQTMLCNSKSGEERVKVYDLQTAAWLAPQPWQWSGRISSSEEILLPNGDIVAFTAQPPNGEYILGVHRAF